MPMLDLKAFARHRRLNDEREVPEHRPDWAATVGSGLLHGLAPTLQAPGDETILTPETMIEDLSTRMTVGSRPGGGYVVAYEWADNHRMNIRAYDSAGSLAWVRQVVVSLPRDFDGSVTGLVGGGAVLTWAGPDSNMSNDIFVQRFDASGTVSGNPVMVNTLATTGHEGHPRVVPLANGGFVVVWGTALSQGQADVRGQVFDPAGAPVGGNFTISARAATFEHFPVIDALPDGGFVVAWFSQGTANGSLFTARAQRFSATGAEIGPEVLVSERVSGQIDMATLSDGGFVVVWYVNNGTLSPEGAGGKVFARRFGPDGNPYPEGEILVTSTGTGRIGHLTEAGNVSVEGLDSNYFLVTWVDARTAVSTVFGRVYNAVGQSPSGVFVANQTTTEDHLLSDGAAALIGNDLVALAWKGRAEGEAVDSVYTRRYALEIPDPILGTRGPDTLNGTPLSDYMLGHEGNDVLNGGAGPDRMAGGSGDDTYIVDNPADQVVELAGGGADVIYAAVNYVIPAGSEVEVLSAFGQGLGGLLELVGNELAQTLIGNAGGNFLNGGGGADVLYGLGGDDTYVVDAEDLVVEGSNGGSDALYAVGSYTLNAGAQVEVMSAFGQGSVGFLELVGNEFAQTVIGNAGANLLNGAGGADVLYGLGGDDTYIVDAQDLVIEGAGGGTDTLYAATSYTLNAGAQVEVMSALGQGSSGALDLVGNELAQTLIGNAGSNFLNGGGGADVLYGLGGSDTYLVDGDDLVIEGAGGGGDAVYATASYVLVAGSEVEVLSVFGQASTGAIHLTGNAFGQTLIGNAGSNILNGAGGSDAMYGLGGADTFAFTTALGGGNVDLLADFNAADDTIALDDALFAGIGGPGAFLAGAFANGAAATVASHRIIYNQAAGQLLYDADGSGAGAAILFATLNPGTALTAADFTVI